MNSNQLTLSIYAGRLADKLVGVVTALKTLDALIAFDTFDDNSITEALRGDVKRLIRVLIDDINELHAKLCKEGYYTNEQRKERDN